MKAPRLLEREHELRVLRQAIEGCRRSDGSIVLIEAAAGLGRSSLLQASRRLAAQVGVQVLAASGRELEQDLPFAVAVALLEAWPLGLARSEERGGGWLLDAATESDPGRLFAATHRLYRLVREYVAGAAGEPVPLALVIDDLQWVDQPSLRFLAYLGERISDLPVALIAAVRPTPAVTPRALEALRGSALTQVLRPGPLSAAAIAAICSSELGEAAAQLCGSLAQATAGNPFLIVELLRAIHGGAGPADGVGRLSLPDHVPEPVLLHVASRLAALPADAARLVRAAAATGSSLADAAELAELNLDRASRAADALTADGLLRPGEPLRFAEPLVKRAVCHLMGEMELRYMAGPRAAGGDERAGAGRSMASAAVGPRISLGAPVGTAQRQELAHAALATSQRGDPRPVVAGLVEGAWGDGALLEEDSRLELAPKLATALLFVDELERCLEISDRIRSSASARAEPISVDIHRARLWALYHRGEIASALAEADAVAAQPGPSDGELSVRTVAAACWMQIGDLERAASALTVVAPGKDAGAVDCLHLLEVRAQLHLARGRPADAIAAAEEAARRSLAAVGPAHPGVASWRSTAALAHCAAGDVATARRLAEEELALAQAMQVPRAVMRALRVGALVQTGQHALDLLAEAVSVGESSEPRLAYVEALLAFGAALRRANQRGTALTHLRRALELARAGGSRALAQRSQEELAAAGAERRRATAGVGALTPSERRVADLAAAGHTTREIAGLLFVTPKTVEFHLRHVYRKLGIPSARAELATALGSRSDAEPTTDP